MRWPPARRVGEREDPYRVACDLVDQAIAFMGDELAGSRNRSRSAAHWKFAQVLGRAAEELVHPRGRLRTFSGDVIPNVEAVLMCFWRPNDLHASPAALRRRAAKPTSTSSLDVGPYVRRAEVARPTLRLRGLLGVAEPILIAGGRAVKHRSEVFVGIDVAKARGAISLRY